MGIKSSGVVRFSFPAFTLLELLIVIALMGLLMAILLPAAEHVRHQAFIDHCANNLRQIGQAVVMYANDHHGQLPRTRYDPAATGVGPTAGNDVAKSDPFSQPPYVANDVTRAMFLLARAQRLPTSIFICPYDDVYAYEADRADPQMQSNFTNYAKNLGYGLADPYPGPAAEAVGFQWRAPLSAAFALAADIGPAGPLPAGFNISAASNVLRKGNSRNHEGDGQNVLYGDGHVAWQTSPFCGDADDEIFTPQGAAPVFLSTKNDSWLTPAGQ